MSANWAAQLRVSVNKQSEVWFLQEDSPFTAALHTAVIKALRKGDELIWDSSRFAWVKHNLLVLHVDLSNGATEHGETLV